MLLCWFFFRWVFKLKNVRFMLMLFKCSSFQLTLQLSFEWHILCHATYKIRNWFVRFHEWKFWSNNKFTHQMNECRATLCVCCKQERVRERDRAHLWESFKYILFFLFNQIKTDRNAKSIIRKIVNRLKSIHHCLFDQETEIGKSKCLPWNLNHL